MIRARLKLYGERNTGTNFLRSLIELNLAARTLRGVVPRWWRGGPGRYERGIDLYFMATRWWNLGWKHAEVPPPRRLRRLPATRLLTGFVTLVKNPYAWLLSLHRRPYHRHERAGGFDSLIRAPWPTVGREHGPPAYANPVEMWNAKARSYLRLAGELPTVLLTYEELLEDPRSALDRVATSLDVDWKGPFRNAEASTKGDDRRFEDYRAYYLEEEWREELEPAAVAWIGRFLDPELMDRFGYEMLG